MNGNKMFGLFDKRMKYLKRDKHPLAKKAIHLYAGDNRSYSYYCGATGSDVNDWNTFKSWIINWVLGGKVEDGELLELYLQWAESEVGTTDSTRKLIMNYWSNGGPPAFNKKDDVSGQFWIFAAWVEPYGS